ncbi:zinc-binding dehydrogenase [Halostella sp. JP-L12]|uniref:zinc-binding dehydrogenase n=1 Tax=Halostella TaxID=1843185 RepID=UPI000EF7E8B1|nr:MULTISPECIES: zinc-binding dehydrogenase [Halostella]NHN49361.1 zinc-binding dehydrogenase [Halostella sp. JP-L12]
MANQAKAAVLREIRKPSTEPLSVEEFDIPDVGDEDILLKMDMAGVCGTDVHILHDKVPGVVTPSILGHENVGTIEELGENVETDARGEPLSVDDRIVVLPASCRECYNCVILNDESKCENRTSVGGWLDADEHPHFVGGFGEYIFLTDNYEVVKIPDDISDEAVVMGDAIRIAVHGFDIIDGIDYGADVLVQGPGPVGLAAIAMAEDSGAGQIIVTGAPDERLELAKKFGADHTISIDNVEEEDRIDQVLDLTDGRGVDTTLEATGFPPAVREGLEMTGINGQYLIMGHYGDAGTVELNPHEINRKQISVDGAWSAATKHFVQALPLLRRFPWEEAVTDYYSLDEVNEAIQAMEGMETVKAVIEP